jgi:hypothetical protein
MTSSTTSAADVGAAVASAEIINVNNANMAAAETRMRDDLARQVRCKRLPTVRFSPN